MTAVGFRGVNAAGGEPDNKNEDYDNIENSPNLVYPSNEPC